MEEEEPEPEGETRHAPEMTKQQAEMMIMGMIRDEKEKKAHLEHQVNQSAEEKFLKNQLFSSSFVNVLNIIRSFPFNPVFFDWI